MYSPLFRQLLTTDDAAELRKELDLLEKSVFQTKEKTWDDVLHNEVRDWVAKEITQALEETKTTPTKLVQDLITDLENLPTLELALAYEPTRAQLLQLHDWLSSHFDTTFVLDLQYQPEILGGVMLSWQGKYNDLSLRKHLNEAVHTTVQKHVFAQVGSRSS